MKRLCVFCGSGSPRPREYLEVARELGTLLGRSGYGLVYGGASIGMMGALADAALAAGAEVIGVIPTWLGTEEIAHRGLSQLIWVETMAERKERMFQLADAFAVLPGGIGTLDELFEVMTMVALEQFETPHGLINTKDYYGPLLELLDRGVEQGLVRAEVRGRLRVFASPGELLESLFSTR